MTDRSGVELWGYRVRPNWRGILKLLVVAFVLGVSYVIGRLTTSPVTSPKGPIWHVLGKVVIGLAVLVFIVLSVAVLIALGRIVFDIEEADSDD